MKIQIRRGCFETNSSSTHSMQIMNGDIDEAYKYINQRIIEKYGAEQEDDEYYFNPESYWKDKDILILDGIEFVNGDENACVYAIVSTWMAKVQYLAMLIHAYHSNIDEICTFWKQIDERFAEKRAKLYDEGKMLYMDDEWRKATDDAPDTKDTEVYKILIQAIKESAQAKYNREITVIDNLIGNYHTDENRVYLDDNGYGPFTKEYMKDIITFKQAILDILNDDTKILFYIDEAYHPYNKPDIKVY